MTKFSLHDKPVRAEDIAFQSMPPDTILLNLRTGYYFSTNPLGAEIWRRCDGEHTVGAIVDELFELYDVDRGRLAADVDEFLGRLLEEGLIHVGKARDGKDA